MRPILRPAALAVAAACALSGCMLASLSPSAKFREQVYDMNEEARWNRIDLAQGRAAPEYKPVFASRRAGWGRRVSVADQEVVQLQVNEDDSAVSVVAISWYNLADMTLRSTVVRQHWREAGDTFAVAGEDIIEGDPGLFEVPSLTPPAPVGLSKGKPEGALAAAP